MTSSARERGRLGAHLSWAHTTDREARTGPARQAFLSRFEREVDPDGRLSTDERAIRAEHALKAHMARLRLARAAKAQAFAVKTRRSDVRLRARDRIIQASSADRERQGHERARESGKVRACGDDL